MFNVYIVGYWVSGLDYILTYTGHQDETYALLLNAQLFAWFNNSVL